MQSRSVGSFKTEGATMRWLLLVLLALFAAAPNTPAESGTVSTDTAARKRLLILGDSITAGYGLEQTEAYPHLLQERIDAAKLPFTVVNAGLSGDTTSGGLRRIDWVLKQPVDVLIIALGGNDGLRGISTATTFSNLVSIAQKAKAKYPQIKLVIAGMQMPPNMGEDYTKAFQAIFPAVANNSSATLIPFLLEGVGGKPELNQADQIHPTAEGHRLIAATVWKELEPLLRSTSGSAK